MGRVEDLKLYRWEEGSMEDGEGYTNYKEDTRILDEKEHKILIKLYKRKLYWTVRKQEGRDC